MPAHFLSLQDGILQHMGVRSQLQGLPCYGIARLVWDQFLLGKGAISVSALTAVFPSGELLDVPGNAVVSNLNIGEELGDAVDIYLHVLSEPRDASGIDLYQGDPSEVSRDIHQIILATQPWYEDARQSMKLAELDRGADGEWRLGSYIPPVLQVGATPFLLALTQEIDQAITHLAAELTTQMTDSFLGGDHVGRLRRGQAAVYRLRSFLADSAHQIHLHPYVLFVALREFYVDACLLQNLAPEDELVVYDHDALAACFGELYRRIMEKIRITPMSSTRLAFVQEGNRFVAGPFPEELYRAREVYWVIQRSLGEEIDLDDIKLASPGRLELVHVNALTGIGFRKIAAPGFFHTFGRSADLYRLDLSEEWRQAMREGAVCFLARPQLANVNTALSWRL